MKLIHDRVLHKTSTILNPTPPHKPDVVLHLVPAAVVEGLQFCDHCHPAAGPVSPDNPHYRSIPAYSIEWCRGADITLRETPDDNSSSPFRMRSKTAVRLVESGLYTCSFQFGGPCVNLKGGWRVCRPGSRGLKEGPIRIAPLCPRSRSRRRLSVL
ncbi:hypothetical protein EVAR_1021_1 [Eumeta japonica]|uniref:Ig-like domain-containing protein n=1 Tax=Eumeta variegata TaxID=151549 RepID=A0A4C1SEI7_EUMVA|nr:hypothetical protein EVAR_1021_1 [Eumeta japonica]